jgi:hypothetical protein
VAPGSRRHLRPRVPDQGEALVAVAAPSSALPTRRDAPAARDGALPARRDAA